MNLTFTPEGKPATLKIEGIPDIHFVLMGIGASREVYQVIDDKGYIIHEQSQTTGITLTVRNIEAGKKE